MKKAILAALLVTFALGLSAQEKNLIGPKWNLYSNSKTTVIDAKTGIITCKNTAPKTLAGVSQLIVLNQKAPKAIVFSGESKAQDVKGVTTGNYCLYADILLEDGSHVWGRTAVFKDGTHDWEKAECKFVPQKAIKQISFYALFRNVTGEASFRNIILTEEK